MKKIIKIIFWPLIMLKNILDPNWWAGLVGEKSGLFSWARKKGEWQNKLTGWKYWAWQIIYYSIKQRLNPFIFKS